MKKIPQLTWYRTVKKYRRLLQKSKTTTVCSRILERKLNMLRKRILRMNRIWKIGIATASLMAWLNAPAVAQFPSTLQGSTLNGTGGFKIDGTSDYDYAGRSVSDAGDVNGDGLNDFLVGAPYADPSGRANAGKAYVVFGNSTGNITNFSQLNGTNGFTISGESTGNRAGHSVSGIGDINNDGLADIIIGAPYANNTGAAYVIFGKSSFGTNLELSSLDGTNGFRLNGISNSDKAGWAVSDAGDFNNDGFDDFLIGAPEADTSPYGNTYSNAGQAYLVFGQSTFGTSSIELSSLNGTNGFLFNGIRTNGELGYALSSAGDMNRDGFDDILIGAPSYSRYGANAGHAFAIFGSNYSVPTLPSISSLSGWNGFVLIATEAEGRLGFAVSEAGDVNDDGFDDIILGAPGADPNGRNQAGEAYVVFGANNFTSNQIRMSDLNGTNGFTISGADTHDLDPAMAVSGGEDINKDGIPDLLIGFPNVLTRSGKAHVVFGKTSFGSSLDLDNLPNGDGFEVVDFGSYPQVGLSVSMSGDVNGDGIADFLLGGSGLYEYDGGGGYGGGGYGGGGYDGGGYGGGGYGGGGGFIGSRTSTRGRAYVVFGRCAAANPELSLTVSPAQVQEDDALNTITYTFTASVSPTCGDLKVNFSVSGTAVFNNDYSLLSGSDDFNGTTGTVQIPEGQTTARLVFQVQPDAVPEPDETIIVTLENP